MNLPDEIKREIVRRILSVSQPDRIILFGSAATNRMNRYSDIDVLVVERGISDRRKEVIRIDEELSDLGYPFDVIVISSEWFNATKDIIGGIAYPANKYGKILYEFSGKRQD